MKNKLTDFLINTLNLIRIPILIILPFMILVCITVSLFYYHLNAQSIGGTLGDGIGTAAGRAIGSLNGLTAGQIEGAKAGKEAGLNAEDTTVILSGTFQETGRLQVLAASGTFSDILSVGDNYAALLSMKYNAVFTVNLSTAEIELREDGLYITLEQPEVEFIPIGEIVKENEYQRHSYTGSAEDGYDALNNSANQIRQKAEEKLRTDKAMMISARKSAEAQLIQLVHAASVSAPEVFVLFKN